MHTYTHTYIDRHTDRRGRIFDLFSTGLRGLNHESPGPRGSGATKDWIAPGQAQILQAAILLMRYILHHLMYIYIYV